MDIRIDDDKKLDVAAGLLVEARGRSIKEQFTLVMAALLIGREVGEHINIEHSAELIRAHQAHEQDRAAAEAPQAAKPADLATKMRSAIGKRGWETRRKNQKRAQRALAAGNRSWKRAPKKKARR